MRVAYLRQSWYVQWQTMALTVLPHNWVLTSNMSVTVCIHKSVHRGAAIMQVRTGTNRSMRGHRDPALTWDVPLPLQKASTGPPHQVT